MQVCERLPMVEVTWQAPRLASGKESKPDDDAAAGSDQRYVLEVHLRRLPGPRGGTNTRAYTPRFPKVHPGRHLAKSHHMKQLVGLESANGLRMAALGLPGPGVLGREHGLTQSTACTYTVEVSSDLSLFLSP